MAPHREEPTCPPHSPPDPWGFAPGDHVPGTGRLGTATSPNPGRETQQWPRSSNECKSDDENDDLGEAMRRLSDSETRARREALLAVPFRNRNSLSVMAHWLEIAGSALVPTRDAIDPARLVSALPFLTIHQVEGPQRSIVRLAGTGVYDALGHEITGRNYFDMVAAERREQADRRIQAVIGHPCGLLSRLLYTVKSGTPAQSESLGLPLVGRGGAVDMILFTNQRLPPDTPPPKPVKGVDAVDLVYLDIGAGCPVDAPLTRPG